jgi:hypothetical protein
MESHFVLWWLEKRVRDIQQDISIIRRINNYENENLEQK